MAEWLYEAGIGEDRAALVENGEIVEAAIELPGVLRVGTVLSGRLAEIAPARRRGRIETARGDVLVEPLPPGPTEGQAVRVEIMREPLPERGRPKSARGRITEAAEREGPSLRERNGSPRPADPFGPDLLEAAGWSDLLDEAASGEIPFAGGALRLSLTPAMALFDVDGSLPPAELALRGAAACGRAIRRLGLGGSIGIDLPTLASKAERQRAGAALDAALPPPFERTAVNGFGFLQLVRRRERPSLPELIAADPVGAAARALLRRAERSGPGRLVIVAAPAVVERIAAERWDAVLARRAGGDVALRADPALDISAGHVHAAQA